MNLNQRKLLITGASGFIGSFVVERALELGAEVWVIARSTSNKRYLSDSRIHFITADLANETAVVANALCAANTQWDACIHVAGVTKAIDAAAFDRGNYQATVHLAEALLQKHLLKGRFVYFSSLSVMGAPKELPAMQPAKGEHHLHINEILQKFLFKGRLVHFGSPNVMGASKEIPDMQPAKGEHYLPINEKDEPQPNTEYGRSKLKTEQALNKLALEQNLDYIALRPTGVYGPREKDYFMMAQSIKNHIDFSVGYKPQDITFIYVRDLVEAALAAIDKGTSGRAYFLTDGRSYASRDYSDLLQQEMGVKNVLHIKAPLWLLRFICSFNSMMTRITRRPTTLNNDKYHILRQRNWLCDITPAKTDLDYNPQWPLERGVKETVAWYKENKWL